MKSSLYRLDVLVMYDMHKPVLYGGRGMVQRPVISGKCVFQVRLVVDGNSPLQLMLDITNCSFSLATKFKHETRGLVAS